MVETRQSKPTEEQLAQIKEAIPGNTFLDRVRRTALAGSEIEPPKDTEEVLKPGLYIIYGKTKTGKSTQRDMLVTEFGILPIPIGDFFKNYTGVEVGDEDTFIERDEEIDRRINNLLGKIVRNSGDAEAETYLLDARLGPAIAEEELRKHKKRQRKALLEDRDPIPNLPIFRIKLDGSLDKRARLMKIGIEADEIDNGVPVRERTTLAQIKKSLKLIDKKELKQWRKATPSLKNVDPYDDEFADIVISITNLDDEHEVNEKLVQALRKLELIEKRNPNPVDEDQVNDDQIKTSGTIFVSDELEKKRRAVGAKAPKTISDIDKIESAFNEQRAKKPSRTGKSLGEPLAVNRAPNNQK